MKQLHVRSNFGIFIALTAALLVMIVKIQSGVNSDQLFHIGGLYDSLRADLLIPDLQNWNFRPIGYRIILGLLSVLPLNIFGWTAGGITAILIFYYCLVFLSVIALLRVENVVQGSLVGLAILTIGSQDSWSSLSADEISSHVMFLLVLAANRLPRGPSRALILLSVLGPLILFLLKGVTVLLFAPVFLIIVKRIGLRKGFYIGVLSVISNLLVLSTIFGKEMKWLKETQLYHSNRIIGFSLEDVSLLVRHDLLALPMIVSLLLFPLLVVLRRDFEILAITLTAVLSATVVDALQGMLWAYHGSPLYSAVALGVALPASRGDEWRATAGTFREFRWFNHLMLSAMTALTLMGIVWNQAVYEPTVSATSPALLELPEIGNNEEVLFLGYGLDYVMTGYPFACSYFSGHPLQRVQYEQLIGNADLESSRQLYECALEFDGAGVMMNLDWFNPAEASYQELSEKLCEGWRKVELGDYFAPSRVFLRKGPGPQAPFCSEREQS